MHTLLAVFLLFPSLASAQAPNSKEQVFTLSNPKDCGVISRVSPNLIEKISDGCLQGVNNLYYDDNWALSRRGGYSAYNLTPCIGTATIKGLWPFYATNGTKYLVAFSSNSMYYSAGDGTCNIINPYGVGWGLSAGQEMQCVQSLGKLNCTDGADPPFQTDVVSSQPLVGAPIGQLIGTFRNRILLSQVSGNLTNIYLSGELNANDWNLPAVQMTTSPVTFSVYGNNDGVKVNCLMGEFQNQYFIGRDYDLFALSGYSTQDFTLRRISEQVGCIEPKSVQEVNNQLLWLSKRGVESLTGTQITPISYMIRPSIAPIIAASGNGRTQTFRTKTDWNGGQLCVSGSNSCISATISPGSIVPSSWSITENSSVGFSSGTTVNITTGSSNGQLFQYTPTAIVWPNAGAELGNVNMNSSINSGNLNGDTTYWQILGSNLCGGNSQVLNPQYGSRLWMSPQDFSACNINNYITVTDMNGVSLGSSSAIVPINFNGAPSWTTSSFDINVASATTAQMQARYTFNNGLGGIVTVTSVPLLLGKSFHFAYAGCPSNAGRCGYAVDVDETQTITTTASYTSQCYDTNLSTPIWGPFTATVSSGGANNLTFQTKTANSCSGTFNAPVSVSANGSQITSANLEAIVYSASFTVAGATSSVSFGQANLISETTGYYITSCVQVSSPTQYGALNVDGATNGGTLTFWTSTGSSCGSATALTATWNPQSANAQISVTTSTQYLGERILFSMTSASNVPTVNDMTFNWNQGNNRPPTSSVQYNDRYYLFYTTNTQGNPHNDHVVVYDFNGKWTFLDDINAYSATLYLNQPYIGDSNATGTIYQLESGQSDNGGNFTYSFQTSDLSFNQPAQRKRYKRLYVFVNAPANQSQNINLNCTYAIDGSTTTYNLGTYNLNTVPEASGYGVVKFPFQSGQPLTGHWINIGCSYTGASGPLKVYGLQIVWTPIDWD